MKRKGRPDPFAYLPLNPTALNRRKRARHQGEMNNLLKSAKKGSDSGARAHKRHKGRA